MTIGPAPIDHETRLKIAKSIADQLTMHFGDKVIAIGLCGSLAQGTDAPYSDIEMHCVLDEPGLDTSLEWSAGDWKAEVDLKGVNAILKRAASVNINWSVTHSIFFYAQPLYDPSNLFIHLRKTAISQPALHFQKAIRQLIIDEIYELAGKIRNMEYRQDYSLQAYYAASLARWGACLIGLDNRFIYPSGGLILKTSLNLDNRPQGYDALCQLVMSGKLAEPETTIKACEDFWQGVNVWAIAKGIKLVDDLGKLLNNLKIS
jgi:kanamycin nucleotidyltransferase